MAGKGKKMAAALAAVSLYLDDEAMVAEQKASHAQVGSRLLEASQWGQSGRQEMMAMRRLVQIRTFTRF